nr:zinc ribbon domain-containing protein [Fervidobacterium sp.]
SIALLRAYKYRIYPTKEQLCSECGQKNPDVKNLAIRQWQCPKCRAKHDRDINAAKNLVKLVM